MVSHSEEVVISLAVWTNLDKTITELIWHEQHCHSEQEAGLGGRKDLFPSNISMVLQFLSLYLFSSLGS